MIIHCGGRYCMGAVVAWGPLFAVRPLDGEVWSGNEASPHQPANFEGVTIKTVDNHVPKRKVVRIRV